MGAFEKYDLKLDQLRHRAAVARLGVEFGCLSDFATPEGCLVQGKPDDVTEAIVHELAHGLVSGTLEHGNTSRATWVHLERHPFAVEAEFASVSIEGTVLALCGFEPQWYELARYAVLASAGDLTDLVWARPRRSGVVRSPLEPRDRDYEPTIDDVQRAMKRFVKKPAATAFVDDLFSLVLSRCE